MEKIKFSYQQVKLLLHLTFIPYALLAYCIAFLLLHPLPGCIILMHLFMSPLIKIGNVKNIQDQNVKSDHTANTRNLNLIITGFCFQRPANLRLLHLTQWRLRFSQIGVSSCLKYPVINLGNSTGNNAYYLKYHHYTHRGVAQFGNLEIWISMMDWT